MKILVLGSTGVLGRNVVPRLIERKHNVRVIVRRTEQARFLDQMGAETMLGDIFDLKSLDQAAHGCEAILHLATAIPKSGEQDWSLNNRVRREGTRNLVTAAVNKSEACTARPCTPTDVLSNTDVVKADVGYADGLVADDRGTGNFAAYLPVGDLTDHWFGNGLTNPRGAEIHIVIHDHGPVIPELAANMLTTYRGGCTDGSLPPTFPDFTKEFGRAGNNTCKLVQVVQFEQ